MHTISNHTVKVDKGISIESKSAASFASSAVTYVNGSKINLNTGSTALKPEKVDELAMMVHSDTTGDEQKGYLSVPGTLNSIATRVPAHTPWDGHNQGVDVKVESTNPDTVAALPNDQVAAVNNTVGSTAIGNPVTESITATVPNPSAVNDSINKSVVAAITSQRASDMSATANNVVDGIKTNSDGTTQVSIGKLGQNPEELEKAGVIKPGSSQLANALASQGKPIEQCLPPNVFTGKNGASDVKSYMNNIGQQVNTQITGMKQGLDGLQKSGLITGKENSNQIAGIVSSTAQFGLDNTKKFISGISNNTDIGKTISSGNFAANLADKSLNPSSLLAGIGAGASKLLSATKNAVQSIVGSIKSALPSIPLNKPINLKELNASAASNSGNNLLTTLKDKAISLGSSLAAAVKKVGSSTGNLNTPSLPGTNSITSNLNANDLAKSLTNNLPSKESLNNLAGKSKELTAKLSTIISSGPDKLKLPSIGANTFNNKSINSLTAEITKVGSDTIKSAGLPGINAVSTGFANAGANVANLPGLPGINAVASNFGNTVSTITTASTTVKPPPTLG